MTNQVLAYRHVPEDVREKFTAFEVKLKKKMKQWRLKRRWSRKQMGRFMGCGAHKIDRIEAVSNLGCFVRAEDVNAYMLALELKPGQFGI
jgi:hypothetical protein